MKTIEEIANELVIQILHKNCNNSDVRNILNKFESGIKKELNEFIIDISKLLPGSDGLGYDGLLWAIDDFKNAIKEVRKDQVSKCVEAAKSIVEYPETNGLPGVGTGQYPDVLLQGNHHYFNGKSEGAGENYQSKVIKAIMNTIEEDKTDIKIGKIYSLKEDVHGPNIYTDEKDMNGRKGEKVRVLSFNGVVEVENLKSYAPIDTPEYQKGHKKYFINASILEEDK